MSKVSRADELFAHVKAVHESEGLNDPKLDLQLTGSLNVTLRPYQEAAVKWMLRRELSDPTESTSAHENFVFEDFNILYPKGGILADEMGLGKTIEVLACILCHPFVKSEPTKTEPNSSEAMSVQSDYGDGSMIDVEKLVLLQRDVVETPKAPFVKSEPIETEPNSSEAMSVQSDYGDGSMIDVEKPALLQRDVVETPKAPAKASRKKRKSSELDKTKEQKSDVPPKRAKKPASGIASEKYASLRAWYEECVGSRPRPSQGCSSASLRCFCDQTPDNEKLVVCEDCGSEQHLDCVGSQDESEQYFCPWCWIKKPPVVSGCTLIVSPSSISKQWIDEIQHRISDSSLKVLFYEGVKARKYIRPADLASYDIVITTYTVLQNELNYIGKEEGGTRKLRYAKKYHAPVSPLTCVKWWRLCLDEAQMVEGGTSKTAAMACELNGVHKWAVTGTPIQKSIYDLYGLVRFLGIEPFVVYDNWCRLLEDEDECFRFLAPILWRNIKNDVFDQIGIPPQTVVQHWCRFSPVEGYFYQQIHTECAALFTQRVTTLINPSEVRIKDIDRASLTKFLMPLLKLRQACIHPQVVRGKYVKFKHTMTMDELMVEMVKKARLDLSVSLRAVVSSLNGLAGLDWIAFDYAGAIDCYRKVLQFGKDYEHLVKIDTLQMIHTLHNLALALEDHGAGVPQTLRDSSLKEEAQSLEEYYLKKAEQQVNWAQSQTTKLTTQVENLADGNTLGYTTWWEQLLTSITEDGDLLTRITSYLEDSKIPGQANLASRIRSLPSTLRIVAVWLADSDVARLDVLKSLRELHKIPKPTLSNDAVACHLTRNAKKDKRKAKKLCALCTSQELLKKYETLIFAVTKQEDDPPSSSEDDEEVENKFTKDLKGVETYKKKKEGNWKPSPQECILRVMASYVKAKKLDETWIQDSNKHLALLATVKKEFKSLRAEWQKITNLVSANDEITMAKLRLRLPMCEEEFVDPEGVSRARKRIATINVIQPYEVPYHKKLLEAELRLGQDDLKRTSGILLYLKNLQEKGTTENEPCPVCQEKIVDKWSVLRCGHCLCFECIPTLLAMSNMIMVECPMCRLRTPKEEVSYVVANKTKELERDIKLNGTYSTKVEAVLTELLHLQSEDPDVKVIMFSTWEKVLDVISVALSENGVSFRRLGTDRKRRESLKQFKNGPVTALLIPLNLGSKGLNIVEATHVFLVEPILNPADELQAIGRVHRIGQTKPTFVHRFVIHNTVEEKMAATVDPEGWSDGNVTVAELFNLFRNDVTTASQVDVED